MADPSRRNSLTEEGAVRETSVVLMRERKLVPVDLVRNGMLRFKFLLETCQPGSLPDPQLMAAVLDLVIRLLVKGKTHSETAENLKII